MSPFTIPHHDLSIPPCLTSIIAPVSHFISLYLSLSHFISVYLTQEERLDNLSEQTSQDLILRAVNETRNIERLSLSIGTYFILCYLMVLGDYDGIIYKMFSECCFLQGDISVSREDHQARLKIRFRITEDGQC